MFYSSKQQQSHYTDKKDKHVSIFFKATKKNYDKGLREKLSLVPAHNVQGENNNK